MAPVSADQKADLVRWQGRRLAGREWDPVGWADRVLAAKAGDLIRWQGLLSGDLVKNHLKTLPAPVLRKDQF
jgi:hypothetical protein